MLGLLDSLNSMGVPGQRPRPLRDYGYSGTYVVATGYLPGMGRTAFGYTFEWSPVPGEHKLVSVAYYETEEEAHEALARALVAMDYEEPRWWQFWRWGSQRLPDAVRIRTAQLQRHQPTPSENETRAIAGTESD